MTLKSVTVSLDTFGQHGPLWQRKLNPGGGPPVSQKGVLYDLGVPIKVNAADQPMGSNECASGVPFPDSAEDVSMESGTDKRSRESPDSTLKPEGKSLKTSEPTTVQTTMDTDEVSTAESVKPSNVTRRPKTVSEVESLMQEVHRLMPAWKATKILETRKASQVDLAALGEATGILFESQDMLSKAVLYLDRLRKKKTNEEDADLDASGTSDSHSSESQNQNKGENTRSDDQKKSSANAVSTGDATVPNAASNGEGANSQGQESSSKTSADTGGQQGETASKSDVACEDKQKPTPESHKEWFNRVTKRGQDVLMPPVGSGRCPTLLTGVQPSDLKSLETFGWKDQLETADLEKHSTYLRERHFIALPHPLEATAWENGFVPETHGLPSGELEPRMLPLLPQLSHMVSAPRQPTTAGNALLTRLMQISGPTGYVIGKLALVDSPKYTSTSGKMRPDECTPWHM